MDARMISEKELALILGLSYWRVRNMRMQEGLPFLQSGKRIFYRLDKVRSWIDKKEDENSKNHTLIKVKVPKYSW